MMLKCVFVLLWAYAQAVEFQIKNNFLGPIWVGIQGNSGKPALNNGGFALDQGQQISVYSPDDWAGRFWARTYCNLTPQHCLTGDCGDKLECGGNGGAPPATLVEITLKGYAGQDFYDISLVDGYNGAATIQPSGGSGNCLPLRCTGDVYSCCPDQLKLGYNGNTIACYSSCTKYNTDQYCCRGPYGSVSTCDTNQWPVNSAACFKSKCPDAYSYAFDDQTSTFTCSSGTYIITFG